ncbi:MAG: putative ATP-binding cassette transporter, partial [Phenylobacterium sp.]
MNFYNVFSRTAPNVVFIAIMLGALAGICYSALIPLVVASITPVDPAFTEAAVEVDTFLSFEVSNYALAGVYLFACILILLTRSASEIMLLRVGSDVSRDIRTRFYRSISNAPLSTIEKMGSAKLMASINIDVPRIISGARMLPAIFINLVTLIGMLGFLMYLNADVFNLVMISIVAGIVVYQLPMMFGRKIFEKNREINDALQESTRGLIYGAKELKLDAG